MPDLLAHALIAYSLALALSWRYGWISSEYLTIAMAGAFIPDLAKAALVLPSPVIERALGTPFDWFALHTTGGVLVSIALGSLVVAPGERRRVVPLLTLGAASHLLADALLLTPSGRSYAVLWPLTRYHPPTPGLYLSTRPEPMIGALGVAIIFGLLTHYRRTSS